MGKRKKYEMHHKTGSKEHRTWLAIRQRCSNPNNPLYSYYGGRGIMCLYENFSDFITDVGYAPTLEHSIDRINNNGNYELGNCRWATKSEQSSNRRDNHWVTINGDKHTVQYWSDFLGICNKSFFKRLRRGDDSKLLEPAKFNKNNIQ